MKKLSDIFPPAQSIALRAAQFIEPACDRLAEIDRVTDQLAAMGNVRPRESTSMEQRWKAEQRMAQGAAS